MCRTAPGRPQYPTRSPRYKYRHLITYPLAGTGFGGDASTLFGCGHIVIITERCLPSHHSDILDRNGETPRKLHSKRFLSARSVIFHEFHYPTQSAFVRYVVGYYHKHCVGLQYLSSDVTHVWVFVMLSGVKRRRSIPTTHVSSR